MASPTTESSAMESIVIFDIPEAEPVLQKDRRQLEYEQYKQDPQIPIYHYDCFEEMEIYEDKYRIPNTNMLPMLCATVSRYFVPVVEHIHHTTTERPEVEPENVGYQVHTQLSERITAYCRSAAMHISIPPNYPVKISGFLIDRRVIEYLDRTCTAHMQLLSTTDIFDTGTFNMVDYQTGQYFATRLEGNYGRPAELATHDVVIFGDEEHAQHTIRRLLSCIEQVAYQQSNSYAMLLEYQQHTLGKNTTPNKTETPDRDRMSIVRDTPIVSLPVKQKYNVIAQLLAKPYGNQRDPFTVTYYPTSQYDLLSAYLINNRQDKPTSALKELTDNLTDAYHKAVQRRSQQAQYDREYWKRIRQLNEVNDMANKKFGISAQQCTAAQLEICRKELAVQHTAQLANKNSVLSQIFDRLRSAMQEITSDALQAALKDAEQHIKKYPTDALYPDGNCPHVICTARVTLENFGKPWLSDKLLDICVQRYTLPMIDQQYFCRICGELLAIADKNGVERNRNDKHAFVSMDDPLLSMIWKELLYTFSTYVRFKIPTPLRQLVSSIAQSIRPLIAAHETALLKSRTTSVDNIRDTLLVYCSIYAYAIISAMIMEDPNNIYFGRENSTTANVRHTTERNKHGGGLAHAKKAHKQRRRVERLVRYSHKARAGGLIEEKDKKKYESVILTMAINLILINKGPIIRRIKHMNADVVKQIFLKTAYAWAKRSIKKQEMPMTEFGENSWPEIDQLFMYVEHYTRITNATGKLGGCDIHGGRNKQTHAKNTANRTTKLADRYAPKAVKQASHISVPTSRVTLLKNTAELPEERDAQQIASDRRVEKILGRTINEVNNALNTAGTNQWSTCNFPVWNIPKPTHILQGIQKKNNVDEARATQIMQYFYDSFVLTYRYAASDMFLVPRVPEHPRWIEYLESYMPVRAQERQLHKFSVSGRHPPMGRITYKKNLSRRLNRFDRQNIILSQFYCKNGERHIPGHLVMRQADGQLVPMKRADIIRLMKEDHQAYIGLKLIDEQCDLCGENIRTAAIKGNKTTFTKKLSVISDRLAFYQYYESRCPEGQLHQITDDHCAKCSIAVEQLGRQQIDPDELDAYYNKYASRFTDIQTSKSENLRRAIKITKDISNRKYSPDWNVRHNYRFAMNTVLEWSQTLNIPYNQLVNIGLSERVEYSDIKNGKKNPSKDTDQPNFKGFLIQQAAKLKSYILRIVRNYSLVIKNDAVSMMPIELKEIFTAQRQLHQLSKIEEHMPDIGNNFAVELSDAPRFEPELYSNWLLNYLAKIIVQLCRIMHPEFKDLGQKLAKYFTQQILDDERGFSLQKPVFKRKDAGTDTESSADDVSGEEFDKVAEQSTNDAEQSESQSEESEEAVANLDDAFDVENAGDIWDTD